MLPRARQDGLLVQEIGNELVVYDKERNRAHTLNPTVALVWQHCDGKTTIAEMAALLHRELNLPAEETLVKLALDRLAKVHLLQERMTWPTREVPISRREMMRKLTQTSVGLLVLPMITSLVIVPTAAHATMPANCGFLSGSCNGYCASGSCQKVTSGGTCSCV